MTFESGTVAEIWKDAETIPLYKGKGNKGECIIKK